MGVFICRICGREINCSKHDDSLFESRGWECPECYVIIVKRRYPRNRGKTLFSPMGSALGDRIIQSVVKEFYLRENPSEEVIFPIGWMDIEPKVRQIAPNKLFWADCTSHVKPPTNYPYYWFSMVNEADALAEMGIYPKPWFGTCKPNYKLPKDYIVVHLRNIRKGPWDESKNIPEILASKILDYLKDYNIILLGNDKKFSYIEGDIEKNKNIYDMRNKLALPRLSYLLERCRLFIGTDSGIAHLAGACGAQMVVWNYISKRWFPKVPKENRTAFVKPDSTIENIFNAIKERL